MVKLSPRTCRLKKTKTKTKTKTKNKNKNKNKKTKTKTKTKTKKKKKPQNVFENVNFEIHISIILFGSSVNDASEKKQT